MLKTTSRSSEVSVNVVPDPSNVVGFPLSEKKAKIIRDPYGNFRVVVRRYYWDSVDQRGKEKREYLGYVVDNVYYATEDYRRHFHRDGTKRCAPKKTLSSILIELGGVVLSSSKWASPSIINVLAPQRTLLPIYILLKHHIDVPLKPQLRPIEIEQHSLGRGVVEIKTL